MVRELELVLGYERWESFAGVLERARSACVVAVQVVGDHLREGTKMVRVGSGAECIVAEFRGLAAKKKGSPDVRVGT